MRTDRAATFQFNKQSNYDDQHGRGNSLCNARERVHSRAKEHPRERVKAKAQGDALAHAFCVRVLTGPAIVFHINGGKGKRVVSSGKLSKSSSPFRQAYLEGDGHDWITDASAFTVSVFSMQNFASFDLDEKFILHSGATVSMGGVDLLQKIREIYADASVNLTSHLVKPLRFSFANEEDKRTCRRLFCLFLTCLGE